MKLMRHTHICDEIVFIDGISGTGKSILMPTVGSFKRVELCRLEHIYEYLCILDDFKKIDPDAAEYMIRLYSDLAIYDSMISREANFRFEDVSGVFRNPNRLSYVKRLFYPDGDVVLDRIQKEKPILNISSHQMLAFGSLAFRAFGNRLRIIEMVRHPLHLLDHWYSYIDRYGKVSRDFSIWIEHQGQALPWFANGWEEKYVAANLFDRVVYAIEFLMKKIDKTVGKLSPTQKKQILYIPFEHFVFNPDPYVEALGAFLGTEKTSKTKRVLKKQKVPRKQVTAGINLKVFYRYGWKPPEKGASEKALLQQKRAFAKGLASEGAMKILDKLSTEYEKRYGLWF